MCMRQIEQSCNHIALPLGSLEKAEGAATHCACAATRGDKKEDEHKSRR